MAAESDEAPFAPAIVIMFAALTLYVLSAGPVYRYSGGAIWWEGYLHPLKWFADHCYPVRVALEWYLDLWAVNP